MKDNKDVLDVTKLILSLMVVAIHTVLYPEFLYPWLRLAVPLFFIISSYLLFDKINKSSKSDEKIIIKNHTIRLLKFYFFWLIALLPITLYIRRDWFNEGIICGILTFVKHFFLGGTFLGSWFITATIFGTIIVYFLSEKFNYKFLIFIFFVINVICCLFSCYFSFFSRFTFISTIVELFGQPKTNFSVSLIYILIGKLYSENKFTTISNKKRFIALIFFCVLLFAEWKIVFLLTGSINNDCYLFLVPVAFLIFGIINDKKIVVKKSRVLRKFSSFIYPLHISLIPVINTPLRILFDISLHPLLLYILVLFVCFILFYIVCKLEKRIKILKYSY